MILCPCFPPLKPCQHLAFQGYQCDFCFLLIQYFIESKYLSILSTHAAMSPPLNIGSSRFQHLHSVSLFCHLRIVKLHLLPLAEIPFETLGFPCAVPSIAPTPRIVISMLLCHSSSCTACPCNSCKLLSMLSLFECIVDFTMNFFLCWTNQL